MDCGALSAMPSSAAIPVRRAAALAATRTLSSMAIAPARAQLLPCLALDATPTKATSLPSHPRSLRPVLLLHGPRLSLPATSNLHPLASTSLWGVRGVATGPHRDARCCASVQGAGGAGEGERAEEGGVQNEVDGGRRSEWMGDEREVEIASRLIAQWKKGGEAMSPARTPTSATSEAAQPAGSFPQAPPQDILLQAVSDLSRKEGRTAKTTNVVMGGTAATPYGDDWLELDKKVNSYPSWRGFTAIGTGGEDFVDSMVVAVESVLEERIPRWQVNSRASAGGRYVSVKIGPVQMQSSDQVRAVYEAMRKDERMRYFL